MSRRLPRLLCALLATAMLLTAVPLVAVGDDETPVRVIVVFKDKVDEGLVKDNGGKVDHKFSNIKAVVAELKPKAIEKLKDSDAVSSVAEDATAYAVGDADGDGKGSGKPKPPAPAQPDEIIEWNIKQIGANNAWTTSTGTGVDVAIVDTGIDKDHPDLVGNIGGGVNFVRIKGKVNSNAWDDDNGHGTHCAGIVAAVDNTIGVVGVAPKAKLWAVKVLNSQGSGSYSDIIKGIDWCIDNGIEVISMSLSGGTDLDALHEACDAAQGAGIVLVAASGNAGATSLPYPAAYDSVISVGATDSDNALAYFSNTGSGLDLVAPGVSVRSTYMGDTYATASGTSMACPHVAGTAALVLEDTVPSTYDADGDGKWDPKEVQKRLEDTADDLGATGYDTSFGHGLVDADGAVA